PCAGCWVAGRGRRLRPGACGMSPSPSCWCRTPFSNSCSRLPGRASSVPASRPERGSLTVLETGRYDPRADRRWSVGMPVRVVEGQLDGKGLRIALVVSRFIDFISERLLAGALDCLRRHGVPVKDLTVARVPGALEIPVTARRLALSRRFEAVICLG